MKHFKVNLFSCIVGAVLIPLLLTTAVAQAQAAPWTVVKSPSPGVGNELFGVASISANDVWAVGQFTTTSGVMQPLTLHWNGKKWSIVKSPTASAGNNTLRAVAAVSTNDVWAVGGFALPVSVITQTLIEHWDGSSWSVVASPNPSTQLNELAGVTAVSASDIWAVGQFVTSGGLIQTLIEHWNGSSWSVVASPNPSTQDNLLAAAAVATNDVWAVGAFVAPSGVDQALIEHWDGSSWSAVTSPSAGGSNVLSGVAIVSATDIWAVGDMVISSPSTNTLIEQWNGMSWSIVTSPNPSSGGVNVLDAAAANPSSGQAWAVGRTNQQTLTEFNP